MVEIEEVEGYAAAALKLARMDGDERPDARLLCKRLDIGIILAPGTSFVGRNVAQIGRVRGQDVIRVRRGLAPTTERFHLLHETAHILFARWGVVSEREEEFANAFAGAVSVPADPLRRVWRQTRDLRDVIATWSHVPATCCALRVGETGCAETVVTHGRRVMYARTSRPLDAETLAVAAEAAAGAVAERPGVGRAYPLSDGPRRAALILETAA